MPSTTVKAEPLKDRARVNEMLLALEHKINFHELREVLKRNDLATAVGWKQLIEKIESGTMDSANAFHAVLLKVHNDLVLAGSKDAQVFVLTPEDCEQIAIFFSSIEPVASAFRAAFPLAANSTQLRASGPELLLTHKVTHQNGDISLIFCACRTEIDREHFSLGQVTEAVRNSFQGYEEFIAIKKNEYQIFDVITIRKSLNRLEILVDHPEKIREPETVEDRGLALFAALHGQSPAIDALYNQNTPVNLFPCINSLYSNFREGRVQRLSFRAPSKSLKRETVSSDDDLRKEPFHEAGIKAVGTITPYDVTIVWDSFINASSGASVRIQAPVGSLSVEGSFVRSARISSAKDDAAIVSVINKLVSYST
ncbi:hypothetical protein [Variovorax paradoxus]